MKRIVLFIMVIGMAFTAICQEDIEKEKETIKKVIQTAYIDGLQNKGDLDLTREGFHPGFNLLGLKNNMLDKFPIYSWIEYAEMKKAKDPNPPTEEEKVTCTYPMIDISGTAAIVKLQFFKGGKHIYTDYLALYKFNEGWKIVNKIYYKLPEEK
ncbi:MAG: nuclear transport factor 2 family protein [Bacteroidota bacterium]|nr:nuclear transport factor 2 family protein [Bacteroidota bacterium]